MIELLSLDLSNYCTKQCSFCYNHSNNEGNVFWKTDEVIAFCCNCIEHGIKAVSLGGGEPFEYDGIFDIIDALYPKCYLSITTNGLPLLEEEIWNRLMQHKPDKVHITIHHPDNEGEVRRVMAQIEQLKETAIKPGVNLLVGADKLDAARDVYENLKNIIHTDQIIVIPQRFSNTPTPYQLASIARDKPFQSPSCLLGCKRPTDFISVSWDKKVNACSYAPNKVPLETLDFKGLMGALQKIHWESCQKTNREKNS